MKNLAGRIALLALIGALAPSALALPPVDPAPTPPRGYSVPNREAGQYLGHPKPAVHFRLDADPQVETPARGSVPNGAVFVPLVARFSPAGSLPFRSRA